MDNKDVLTAIGRYANEWLKEPRNYLTKGCFEQRSYAKWAIDELWANIKDSGSTPPLVVIEKFICKMDKFSCKKTNVIFSIAYDVATEVLDFLINME